MNFLNRLFGISKSKLAYKISFVILLVITFLGVSLYFTINSIVTKNLYEQHKQRGVSIASALAANAVDLLLLEKFSHMQFLLQNTQDSDQGIVYIFTIDPKRQVLAHTFPGGFPKALKGLNQGLGTQAPTAQLIETQKGVLLDVSVPIMHGSLGSVHVGLSRKTIERELSEIQRRILLSCILACLASILISLLFSRRITKPLTALEQGAENIGEGNLSYRVYISSSDELGVVSNAFNQMAASLEEDIEKRVRAEKALKESEELYRSLVENINMGITLIDQEHTVLMTNAAHGRLFREKTSEFIGQKCYQKFCHRNSPCPDCPGMAAMKEGCSQEIVTKRQRTDGSTFTARIKAFPVLDSAGINKGFVEVVEDVTKQLKMQQELADEKERLAVTLRSIGDGVITTDISGNIVLLNKAAEKLTGWSNQEAAGRPSEEVFQIINEQTREICENPVTKVISSTQITEMASHTILIGKDGRERNIADSGAPILNDQSTIVGVVLVFRDVTEELKTEKELLKVKKLESVGILAGGIAHDFNNILAAILGNINLALFDSDLKEKTKELLAAAEKASYRAKGLTQQLLTFAKGGEPVKEASLLASVIKDSANIVLRGDKVACHYDVPEDLWLADIDKGQISQVIQNIVINASQAMPEGGVITITCENFISDGTALALAEDGRFVKISIQDNGTGMPASVLENIFDPYFSTKEGGSGLGLAITQSIIKRHNGNIVAESSPGVGSTFTMYLPASEKTEVETQAEVQKQESLGENKTSSPVKILVMDDEEMVREVSKAILMQLGHEVILSGDGEEALEKYQEAMDSGKPIDLVIMDLTIPGGMGGQEAVQEILKIDADAKVIVSSGYSNDQAMAHFKEYGFCSAIVKPYHLEELAKTINLLMDE